MKLTFLGTGTSFGVPVVGCDCPVCTSDDPRDRRSRSGALLELPEGRLLIDAPPELRVQLLREGIGRVDAVWITHPHADHVHGLDDLRVFTLRGGSLPAYLPAPHLPELATRFPYVFDPNIGVPWGTTKPQLDVRPLAEGDRLDILGASVRVVTAPHGDMTVYGLRVGGLGYLTDAKRLTEDAVEILRGVDTLVLNALWWGRPHATHFNIEEAVDAARSVGASNTYLVHLTHRVGHAELEGRLPPDVHPAFDGLSLEIP